MIKVHEGLLMRESTLDVLRAFKDGKEVCDSGLPCLDWLFGLPALFGLWFAVLTRV